MSYKPLLYQLFETIDFNTLLFMYKAFHNLLPTHLLSRFKKVNDSHNHNTINNIICFKVRFRKTSKKASIVVPNVECSYAILLCQIECQC